LSGRLLVVSNRLPLTLRRVGDCFRGEPSSGGLATALEPVLRRSGGLWIGWPGEAEGPEAEKRSTLRRWEREHGYVGVELPRDLARRYYHGLANETLWPLFHHFPSRVVFDPRGFEAYVEANRRFRDSVLERLEAGDRVWIHDYHLMLLPAMLREARPDVAIGFFLHIPFPASEVFRILPRREELLRGLLGADLVAFHTHGHLQHFRASLLRILGLPSRMDGVDVDGRMTRLEALPIGITPGEFQDLLRSDLRTRREAEELATRFEGRCLLLAVDRLDYTKGIPERLRAFRRLLQTEARFRERVVLVQVAVPSREPIPSYRQLREDVNRLVGEINGEFGTPGWTPIVYIRRSVPRAQLAALYAAADVAWVTPLRDGMNLVAKEYVACQLGGKGVLVLSELAGAAAEMGEALLVNPYDEERTAASIVRALDMPADERRDRLAALNRRVTRMTAAAWSEHFLRSLDAAASARQSAAVGRPAPLPRAELAAAHRASTRRLLLLDYDGTLVGFAGRPAEAAPPPGLRELLARLASDVSQTTAIVSGRPQGEIDRFFGGTPGLWLAAEHGAILRSPGGAWETLRPSLPQQWKERVQPVLEHFVLRTPGSFVEEKEYCLVWHYRMADPEFGEWLSLELLANLEEMLAETELRAVPGNKSVEVRLAWATKAEVARRLEAGRGPFDFRLAMGDDRTDEDLFAALPPDAYTVHVGEGPSRARYRVASPERARELLESLALPPAGEGAGPPQA